MNNTRRWSYGWHNTDLQHLKLTWKKNPEIERPLKKTIWASKTTSTKEKLCSLQILMQLICPCPLSCRHAPCASCSRSLRIPSMGRCRTDACETAIFMQYDFSNYYFPNVDERECIWPEDFITIWAEVKYFILNHMYVVKFAVKLFIVWRDKQKS